MKWQSTFLSSLLIVYDLGHKQPMASSAPRGPGQFGYCRLTINVQIRIFDRLPSRDEVHLWIGAENVSRSTLEAFTSTLSLDELTRANKFRFQKRRSAYIFSQGLLRDILARYTESRPRVWSRNSNGPTRTSVSMSM